MKKILVLTAILTIFAFAAAEARGRGGRGRGDGPKGPPTQAIEACTDLEVGDACTFESPRRGTVEGTCAQHPRIDKVSCVPNDRTPGAGGRGGGPKGPPPQAIEACTDLEVGASCTFESPRRGTVEGTCNQNPRLDKVTCMPNDRGMRGAGGRGGGPMGPPPEAIDACQDQEAGAACSFESPRRGTVEGTCGQHPRVGGMSCIPNDRTPGAGAGRQN